MRFLLFFSETAIQNGCPDQTANGLDGVCWAYCAMSGLLSNHSPSEGKAFTDEEAAKLFAANPEWIDAAPEKSAEFLIKERGSRVRGSAEEIGAEGLHEEVCTQTAQAEWSDLEGAIYCRICSRLAKSSSGGRPARWHANRQQDRVQEPWMSAYCRRR